jgi:Uncharacterised ArCR, COG2043
MGPRRSVLDFEGRKWDTWSMSPQQQPDPSRLQERLQISRPLIGFYDAPDPALFGPLVEPGPGQCVFCSYGDWQEGKTLHLTRERYGCGGAAGSLFGVQTRPREEFIKFLAEDEGLKASRALMERWIDARRAYRAENGHLFIGPLKASAWAFARTVTFLVDPDQLSALAIGAQYRSAPDDPPPVIAPFGSGCSQLVPFRDLRIPQASIGSTDIAMRQHLPPDVLAFVVTRTMFQQLCELDERSFLYKPFLERLKKARGGRL